MSSGISADNYAPKEKHSSVVWRKTTSSKNFQPEVSVIHIELDSIWHCGFIGCNVNFYVFSEWSGNKEDDDDVNVWEDNWDDDNVEDDFSKQLRAQLESQKK